MDHAAELTADHAAEIDRHVRVYITVFVVLMALTIITVAVSYLDLSPAMAIVVALFIATVKGSLVACYFMHLISEKKLIYAVLVITVIKFVALLALPALTHGNGYWIHEEPGIEAPAAPATTPH
jgi:cytochrome c oxidase subunit 4